MKPIPQKSSRGVVVGHRFLWMVSVSACLFLFVGCQSYTDRTARGTGFWATGQPERAAEQFSREIRRGGAGRDELLLSLETGSAWRAAGEIHRSEEAFARADALLEDWERRADLLMAREAGALLSNQAARPYRGRSYDAIMLSTYRALNAMRLGELERARVELNRALERQRNAVAANARRLEEAADQARLARTGRLSVDGNSPPQPLEIDRSLANPTLQRRLDAHLTESLPGEFAVYVDYVNPFTVFLDGLFFLHTAVDGSDLERARVSFRRLAEMSSHSGLAAELRRAEAAADGTPPEPAVYIIFETGRAPTREEARIDVPLFLVSDRVSYLGAAFPHLRYHGGHLTRLEVETHGGIWRTERVASMESVIAKEFQNEWPAVVTRTLLAAAAKAVAAYQLERSVEGQGDLVRVLTRIAVVGYQYAVNRADLRTWTTLPKEFQFVRIPVPNDGLLRLRAGAENPTISIEPNRVTVVYVQSVSARGPVHIHQFTLP